MAIAIHRQVNQGLLVQHDGHCLINGLDVPFIEVAQDPRPANEDPQLITVFPRVYGLRVNRDLNCQTSILFFK
jgi:hypothetical protein